MQLKLNDNVYNVAKWTCLIFLPALSILYAALDGIFGWGYTEMVIGVIAAIETFIGSLIGVSTKVYLDETKKDA